MIEHLRPRLEGESSCTVEGDTKVNKKKEKKNLKTQKFSQPEIANNNIRLLISSIRTTNYSPNFLL